jgi:O-antigen/teichoic acid export membrane protein
MAFVAGLLIVRFLSKQEYAFYTITNAMQGTLSNLADIGVGSALSAIGGRVWQDRGRFGELIVTGLDARRRLALAAGLVVTPLAFFTLRANGANWLYALAFCLMLLIGLHFQLLIGVLVMVPRLQGRIDVLQRQDLVLAAFRLAAVAAMAVLFATAGAAIFVSVLAFVVGVSLLRRWAAEGADLSRAVRADDAKEIWRVVRQQAPDTVYYCFQGQITVFLLSWFGSASLVAEVGALGRVTMVLNVIGSVMSSIVLPRFARCQDRARVRQIYLATIGVYVLIGLSLLLLVYLAPGPFLWLLGPRYADLSASLLYMTIAAVSGMLAGAIYSLNSSRAWTEGAWISVPVTIAAQLLLLPFVDIGTVRGVALLGAVASIPSTFVFFICAWHGFRALKVATS